MNKGTFEILNRDKSKIEKRGYINKDKTIGIYKSWQYSGQNFYVLTFIGKGDHSGMRMCEVPGLRPAKELAQKIAETVDLDAGEKELMNYEFWQPIKSLLSDYGAKR